MTDDFQHHPEAKRDRSRGVLSSSIGIHSHEDGFSLLETLIALAFIAAISALSFSSFTGSKARLTPEAAGREVARMLQTARLRAISTRTTVDVVFDLAQKRIGLSARDPAIQLPKEMRIRLQTGRDFVYSSEMGSILFYADGSSSGGKVEFSIDGYSTSQVKIPWLTGIPKVNIVPRSFLPEDSVKYTLYGIGFLDFYNEN